MKQNGIDKIKLQIGESINKWTTVVVKQIHFYAESRLKLHQKHALKCYKSIILLTSTR